MATTERVVVEDYRKSAETYLIYLFHLVAYRWFASDCRDMEVLDFGCGTGYGSAELAEVARRVVGVDVSAEAIAQSRNNCRAANVAFLQIQPVERERLPFGNGSFDVVVSNQVIEHVPDPNLYLAEARCVLRQGGIFFVVTPDRNGRLFPRQKPWNRYHLHEYGPDGLARLVGNHFEAVEVFGMTGRPDVISRELKRTRKARLLTLPFTYGPEAWRQFGLSVAGRLRGPSKGGPPDFGDDVVWISKEARPSVNVCIRARAGRA